MSTQQMTVAELRQWLGDWVAEATGLPRDQVSDDRPMEEFGLSSRDAVALSGEVEELLGVTLSATVAYEHPTIAALAKRILEGPAEPEGDVAEELAPRVASGHPDIAIVGLATRFPGGADTPEQMWQLLAQGRDAVTPLPPGRWEEFLDDPFVRDAVERANIRGGFIEGVADFDHEFFNLAPREAEMVDPQQRIALELAWEALEDAHIPANTLRGTQVGVFIGSSSNDYSLLTASDPATAHPYALTGTASSIIPNRVSYVFDFRGPSVSVDTACSSSLVAVHQAVQSLRLGESDVALAGGVNMLLAPAASLGFAALEGVLAPDGRIKAFSKDADGIVRSEGGGLVVLKRLADAEAAGDTVLAVIAGSAVNSDGRSNGLTAPNPEAQVAVLRAAYRDAGVTPREVDYVEAHGTGTLLGDPIEAEALGRVLGRGRDADRPMLLGSAKTNFGHLESAAGAAGLIKVVLAMRHGTLPPTINFAGPNPYIPFDRNHLRIVDTATPWPRYSGAAIAGVSGFGFGGTNAHVVVREYTAPTAPEALAAPDSTAPEDAVTEGVPLLFPVSAAVPSRRRLAARDLADWLESAAGAAAALPDVARALAHRNHGRSRAVVLARTREELLAGLRAIAAGKARPGVWSADSPAAETAVWVFSGFGSQHRGMGRALYEANPVFAARVDELDELIADESGHSVREMFLGEGVEYRVESAQLAIFTVQVALAATLRHYGAAPGAVLGHSLGEVAAAAVSGGLPLEEAVRVVCARARLMGELEGGLTGDAIRLMAIVEYSAAELDQFADRYPDLEICVYAAPNQTVVGGPEDQVRAVVERAQSEEKLGRILDTKGAGHTAQVDPVLGELHAELTGLDARNLTVGLYSSVVKDAHFPVGAGPVHGEDYWASNMRRTVYFTNAVQRAVADGRTTFVELAPHPIALMSVAASAYAAGLVEPQLVYTQNRKEDAAATLLGALAQLYTQGDDVDIAALAGPGGYADIPRTAWIKRRHWTRARAGGAGTNRLPGAHVSLPDGRHAWEVHAGTVADIDALLSAAATQVLADAALGAVIYHGDPPAAGTLTTVLHPHPGGASMQVHVKEDGGFRLLAEAVVTADGPLNAPEPGTLLATPAPVVAAAVEDLEPLAGAKWDPEGGEPLEERLAEIVAGAMGYAAEDLPTELPLIELGLDSLMAVRIKNRVQYEFDLPDVQVQALRDASLRDVAKYVRYGVENREEVAQLAARQQAAGEAAEPVAAAVVDAAQAAAAAAVLDVPPRDAAERLTFAQWAVATGKSAGGIFNPLPTLDGGTAAQLAAKLSERVGGEITPGQVLAAPTIERLSDVVRNLLEGDVGLVRTLRARPAGSTRTPVFVFHPAGGSTVVYEPLLNHLPADVPMYGFERVEGPLDQRVREYLPLLRERQPHGPYVLGGWSLGGALAYEMARQLRAQGEEVALLALLDTVFPSEPVPDTPEEIASRWRRFIDFAEVNYGVRFELPVDELVTHDDAGQIALVLGLLKQTSHGISGGIIEHQRTSYLDNRAIHQLEPTPYDGAVVLYKAERMHDGAIELEPRYAQVAPDGGWGPIAPDLEIVHLAGDHLAVVDEPVIATVGKHLARKLAEIDSRSN